MQHRPRCLPPSAGPYKKLIDAASRRGLASAAEGKCAVFSFVPLPLVESQVSVGKLCQQGSLQDLLGRLVLDEVDDDVL